MRKVVIPAPFWGQPGHLGWTRVSRFVRWLREEGVRSVVARAGSSDRVEETEFGEIITVRDPIGFYRDLPQGAAAIPLRSKSRLRRTLAYLLLVPDPLVPWSQRAARHPLVLDRARGADLVLASSPPESVHVAAAALARRLRARLVMDLRDGWLDEPMIPLLRSVPLQRLRHRRLEARLMRRAERILVTSGEWRRLLAERLPQTTDKTEVITNCYPPDAAALAAEPCRDCPGGPLTLLYAGKFFGSRAERRMDELFGPLVKGMGVTRGVGGRVLVVGNLLAEECSALAGWREGLGEHGWTLEVRPPVPRDEALRLIGSADGLLLLSSSMASLPAKLFDYLPSGRPILAVAPRGSAVWQVGRALERMWMVDPAASDAAAMVAGFLADCSQRERRRLELPERFSEASVRPRFLGIVAGVLDQSETMA